MKWNGFRPVAYFLGEKALNLPLTLVRNGGDLGQEENTSMGELLLSLKGKEFQIEDQLTSVCVTTETHSMTLRGPTFNCRLAAVVLQLQKEGVEPFASSWFWYDKDVSDTDPTDSYTFFVVHQDKIVREAISFLDYHASGFDPAVFDSGDDKDTSPWDVAKAAYWYRWFYRETRTGQLMTLRPDSPVLHHYEEGHAMVQDGNSHAIAELLKQIRSLLWVGLVFLGIILFLLVRK